MEIETHLFTKKVSKKSVGMPVNYCTGQETSLKQCFGSALVSVRIRIQHYRTVRIWIQIPGFVDKKFKKIYRLKKICFDQKFQFTYP
jgi:hypothetical protein